ncbi:MAG: biotin transporter BioY [Rhodospirillales bacterium]
MAGSDVMRAPLAAALWPATGRGAVLRAATLAVFGSLLLWASAKVQVPFWPVPMTMQTYVVLVIGAAYGARLGAATVALYLAQGFAGLPVFAGAATGPAYLMGPTAGYLVGFAAAAAVVGWLVDRGGARSVARMVVVMAVGSAVILSLGVAWLSAAIGFERAVAVGLLPFLTGDVLKTALAAATLPLAWRAIDRKA